MFRRILTAFTTLCLIISASVLTATPAQADDTYDQNLARVYDEINQVRAQVGKPPYVINEGLASAAHDYAQFLYDNNIMTHDPGIGDKIPPGWITLGDNLGANFAYYDITQGWVDSPSHYANLIGDYSDMGLAYVGDVSRSGNYTRWALYMANYPDTVTIPSVPTDFKADRAASGTKTHLSWGTPSVRGGSQPGYRIKITDGEGNVTVVDVGVVYSYDVPVASDEEYEFNIRAYNSVGEGQWSQSVFYTYTAVDTVDPVITPDEFQIDEYQAIISFTHPGDVDLSGFNAVLTSPERQTVHVHSEARAAFFINLSPFTTYEGYVEAVYDGGISNRAYFEFTTTGTNPYQTPGVPANISVSKASFNELQVTWSPVDVSTDVDFITYEVSLYDVASGEVVNGLGTTETSAMFTIQNDGEYRVGIRAENSVGMVGAEGFSTSLMFEAVIPELPNAPADAELVEPTSSTLRGRWSPPPPVNSPVLEYHVQLLGEDELVYDFNTPDTEVLFMILDPKVEYTLKVTSVNSAGESPNAAFATGATLAAVPGAPASAEMTRSDETADDVRVAWTAPAFLGGADVLHYDVKLYRDGKVHSVREHTVPEHTVLSGAEALVEEFDDLPRGHSYSASVAAVNEAGSGTVQVTNDIVIDFVKSSAPLGFKSTKRTPTTVQFKWSAPADTYGSEIDAYRVKAIHNDKVKKTKSYSGSAIAGKIGDLKKGTAYTFKIQAETEAGYGEQASFKVSTKKK